MTITIRILVPELQILLLLLSAAPVKQLSVLQIAFLTVSDTLFNQIPTQQFN
jgi:hypothetical protein